MTTTHDLSYLDAPEHLGKEYDHIRTALKMYVKVLEAVNTSHLRKRTVRKCKYPVGGDDTFSYDSLLSEKFLRLLHYINETFHTFEVIDHSNPLYAEAQLEVSKLFHGVGADGLPWTKSNSDRVETGLEYCQRLWTLPPELLEPTIAIAIVRDLFVTKQPATSVIDEKITVRGKEVVPWREFCSKYTCLILA